MTVVKDEKNVADASTAKPAGAGKTDRTAKAPKSEQTRTLILETALRLFEEHGYDRTTMRAIAKEAGVSVGNAYYYFSSKEHLVQGFYDRIAAEHEAAVRPVLAGDPDLAVRIRGVLLCWLDVAEQYHRFAAQFFKNAADPDSPLSPSRRSPWQPARRRSPCTSGAWPDPAPDTTRNWPGCCRS